MLYFRHQRRCIAAAIIFGLSVGGCSTTQQSGDGEKTAAGLALGSIAGGLVGSQIGGGGLTKTLVGAAAGGVIGAAVGAALDEQDKREMARLTQLSFESGEAQEYTSPRTGAHVRVKIIKTTRVAKKLCRTATQEVGMSDGSKTSDSVTACKGSNGWVV